MAFGLNLLRALFGLDGQAAAPQAGAAPVDPNAAPAAADPAGWSGGPPDFSAPRGAVPFPGVAANQTSVPMPGVAANNTAVPMPSMASSLPQLPTSPGPAAGLIDTSALPQRPVWGKRSAVGDTLDNLFLGGAIQKARTAEFGQQEKNYNDALQLAQLKAQQALYASISDPKARLAAVLNPAKFGENVGANYAPQTVKAGDSLVQAGDTGQPFTAPQFDDKSGTFVQAQPGGGMVQSPGAGGDFKAEGGIIASGRTGDVANRYALPQVLAPGARIGAMTPGVAGAPSAAAGLPQLPAPTAPGAPPMASPADVLAAAPGARITSGYRSRAHNHTVGGVPNSWHTTGTPDAPGALDLTPGPGGTVPGIAAQIARSLPQLRVLNEGDHAHVQPNASNTGGPALAAPAAPGASPTGSIIDNGAQSGPLYGPKTWNPITHRFEQTNQATGKVEDAGAGADFNPQGAKQNFADSTTYKDFTASLDSFKAMLNAASLPSGGMRAYALRDTFARTINPGAVARAGTIEAIKQAQGVPESVRAYFLNLKGDGDVPPATAQQILDVSRGFLASHYGTAKAMNDSNGAQASRYSMDPVDATVPMEAPPGNVHLSLPPQSHLIKGDIYKTGQGLGVWSGTGFKRYGG